MHENAHSHSAAHTKGSLQKLNLRLSNTRRPVHTLRYYFHLFELLKEALRLRRFADDDEVKGAVQG